MSRHAGNRLAACLVVAALSMVGCNDADQSATTTSVAVDRSATHPELGATTLKVMTFNIWLGGGLVAQDKVVEAIEASGADIVGLQEAAGNSRLIADAMGWYAEPRMHVISRYPIIQPPDGDGAYVFVQLAPGQVVAVGNVHLPSDPYGPDLVLEGEPLDAVLANETDTRMPSLEPLLPVWQSVVDAGIPLFVTGDFNAPSHLDWTGDTVDQLPHMKYAVAWPVSTAMEQAGFTDTFRAANPDPSKDPGRTWTYGYPYPRVDDGEVIDRIDLVFASEGVEVTASEVVGETGTPDVDIAIDQYPSDHRAVVSTVTVDPVEPPLFVAVDQHRVDRGDRFGVRYHAPAGEDIDRLVVVATGESAAGGEGIMWLPPMEAEYFGEVLFGSGNLTVGEYDVVLLTEGDQEVSRSRFWVVEPGASPEVSVDAAVPAGDPIEVTWANAPGERFDWLGIYPAGELDIYNGYLAFAYTETTITGSYSFTSDDFGDDLPAGEYVVVLASDDHYIVLASDGFTVE